MALDPMSMSDAVDLLLKVEDHEGQKYINEFLAGPDHDIFARNPELVAEIRDAVRDHAAAISTEPSADKVELRRAARAARHRAYRQRQYGQGAVQ
jgi:hypothetical protein